MGSAPASLARAAFIPMVPRPAAAPRSDHDTLDLVDGHRGRRPVVELRRLRRRVPRRSGCACSRVPPFDRYAVVPVARNVWQHVEDGGPAVALSGLGPILPRSHQCFEELKVDSNKGSVGKLIRRGPSAVSGVSTSFRLEVAEKGEAFLTAVTRRVWHLGRAAGSRPYQSPNEARQGKARQGKARQGKARPVSGAMSFSLSLLPAALEFAPLSYSPRQQLHSWYTTTKTKTRAHRQFPLNPKPRIQYASWRVQYWP